MKRIISILITFVIIAACLPMSAISAGALTKDKIVYNVEKDGTLTVYEYKGSESTLTIPDTVNGRTVKKLAFEFLTSKKTTTLNIPASVEKIDKWALRASYLTEINVDENSPKYSSKDGVLYNKAQTTLVSFPPGKCKNKTFTVPDGVKKIGNSAFMDVPITGVNFPDTLEEIGNDAFCFSSLKSVTVPASVKIIGDSAFTSIGIYSLKSVTLTSGLEKIGADAFAYSKIKTINIPNTVTEIGGYAFYNTPLTEVTIPGSVKKLGSCIFGFCGKLEKVTIEEGVPEISYGMFDRCRKLKSIKLPSSVTKIGKRAFSDSGVETIKISKNVKSIGNGAFSSDVGSPKLKKITVAKDNKHYCTKSGVLYNKKCTKLLLYPAKRVKKDFKTPKTVKIIGNKAFYGAKIDNLTITGNVKTIEKNAFEYADIKNFKMNEGVKKIGAYAFYYCNDQRLWKLKLPDSINKISHNAFYASGLITVNIPKKLKTLESEVFFGTYLTELTVPSSVTKIKDGAFGYNVGECGITGDAQDWFVVKGETGSAAHKYAKKVGLQFVEI